MQLMKHTYKDLIKKTWDFLAWAGNLTQREEIKGEEYFFEWTQWDNSDQKQILMTLRLALFNDCVAITTWQEDEQGTERRSVSVTSVEQGMAIINYFTNITTEE